jgi:hypothetical protein
LAKIDVFSDFLGIFWSKICTFGRERRALFRKSGPIFSPFCEILKVGSTKSRNFTIFVKKRRLGTSKTGFWVVKNLDFDDFDGLEGFYRALGAGGP